MVLTTLLRRYDRMNGRDSAKLLAVIFLVSFAADFAPNAFVYAASVGINCICSGFNDVKFALSLGTPPPTSQRCGTGDLDICMCEGPNGETYEVDIPHVEWLTDLERLEIDINCTPILDDSIEESTNHALQKRDTQEAEKVYKERKTNVLSRSISGVGSVISGAGDAFDTGVTATGAAAGSVISGGFHLVGTATRKITEFAGNTVKAVGGVFEGSKTITEEEATKKRPRRDVSADFEASVGIISNKEDMKANAQMISDVFSIVENVKNILNDSEDIESAKKALQKLIDKSHGPEEQFYITYYEALKPEAINHDIDEIGVVGLVDSVGNSTVANQTRHIKQHFDASDDLYTYAARIKNADVEGDEKMFADAALKKAKDNLHCGQLGRNTEVADGVTFDDVLVRLLARSTLCDGEDSKVLQDLVKQLQALPVNRHKRSIETAPKKKKKKAKKLAKKKRLVKTSHAEHAEEVPEEGHEEVEEVEEEEEVEHDAHSRCTCDPDTCRPLS